MTRRPHEPCPARPAPGGWHRLKGEMLAGLDGATSRKGVSLHMMSVSLSSPAWLSNTCPTTITQYATCGQRRPARAWINRSVVWGEVSQRRGLVPRQCLQLTRQVLLSGEAHGCQRCGRPRQPEDQSSWCGDQPGEQPCFLPDRPNRLGATRALKVSLYTPTHTKHPGRSSYVDLGSRGTPGRGSAGAPPNSRR